MDEPLDKPLEDDDLEHSIYLGSKRVELKGVFAWGYYVIMVLLIIHLIIDLIE